jgi:hypothetical protein
MLRPSPISLSFIMVILGAACAGPNAEQAPDKDRTFAEIQVQEAGIERSRAELARADAACADQCREAADASGHERLLCELAHASADADALERCDRAARTCAELSAGARARCRCQDD